MTGKRFSIDLEYDELNDAKGVFPSICFTDGIDWYSVCEKLNDLDDENEQLKIVNRKLEDDLDRCESICDKYDKRIDELKTENQMLQITVSRK